MINAILLVCLGNTCRSAMGEGLLREAIRLASIDRVRLGLGDDRFKHVVVESAGTYINASDSLKGSPANPHAIRCMAERRLDISRHRSRAVSEIDVNHFQLIVCMTSDEVAFVNALKPAVRGAVMLANATKGGVPNPYNKGPEAYEECAKILESVAIDIIKTFF